MKRFVVTLFSCVMLVTSLWAQRSDSRYTLSGYVKDAATGEEIIGATIVIRELPGTGAATNAYGYFAVTLPAGNYRAMAQAIGYQSEERTIQLDKNQRVDFVLGTAESQLEEVVISDVRRDENIVQTQMGIEKLDMKEIENIPVLMGEKDVLKTIQLRPGVKSAGEGNSGFYVRGGGADQNLILLDEATVYNASHLLGFFSVFNTDALKDVTLYKGSQPAVYGGRLSSVLDIRMQDGNDKEYGAEGGIGLISSRLKIDGPIVKDKGSFTISGRRTYADLFLKLSPDSSINRARLYFYDLNAKANYRINDKNRIFLSGYFGKDVLGFGDNFGFDWGNATGTLRWNHLFSHRLFSNTSLIYSNYRYNIHIDMGALKGSILSRIQNYNLKQDFQYYADHRHELKFGINSIYHQIVPGGITIETNDDISKTEMPDNFGWENAAYISHKWKFSEALNVEYGFRASSFSAIGPGDFYTFSSEGVPIDTATYGSGDFVKTYFFVEPRFALNYILNEVSAVKLAYGRNTQNLHLLSNTTSGNPTDLWIPSSINVKPQVSDMVSLGYFRNFADNNYEFSVETYYKDMQNQIDYKDGAQLQFNTTVESQLLIGVGRAYGIEFFVKKKYGRLNGWIGYTLAKSERKIEGINGGDWYNARQDRTHDVSVVGIYELAPKWVVSAAWVYYTGNAITFPSGKYNVGGHVVNYYTERNGYRMPDYHRMDIGVTWIRKKTDKRESSWNFSLYNAYGRENAYSITFEENPDDPSRTQAVRTTLFRWIPAITYNFKF